MVLTALSEKCSSTHNGAMYFADVIVIGIIEGVICHKHPSKYALAP